MRVISDFFYYGANRRIDRPVIEQAIRFEAADLAVIAGKAENLEARLTHLLRDNGILEDAESFPFEPLPREPMAWFCLLYAQLAILFQQKCGHEVGFYAALPMQKKWHFISLIEYEHIDVGRTAAKFASRVMTLRLEVFRKAFEKLRDFAEPRSLPRGTRAIIEAARRRDIPVIKMDRWPLTTNWNPDLEKPESVFPNAQLMMGHCGHQRILEGTWCRTRSGMAVDFGKDRNGLSGLLDQLDIPLVGSTAADGKAHREYRALIGNGRVLAVLGEDGSGAPVPDVLESTHESIREQLLNIYRSLETAIAEIRFKAPGLHKALSPGNGGVTGIDVAPRLDQSIPRDSHLMEVAANALLDWIFPDGAPSRIPIIAVTGTNGKTTACRMLDAIYRAAGHSTGLVCSDGVYIDRKPVFDRDQASAYGHLRVFTSPTPEVAILETNHRGLMQFGLAFDWCDVAVCLNVTPDHIGAYEIDSVKELARIKRSLIETARYAAVLNADDENCLSMLPHVSAETTCLVSRKLDFDSLRRLAPGVSSYCWLQPREGRDWVMIYRHGVDLPVIAVDEIPACYGGAAEFNVYNSQHAIAASCLAGVDLEAVCKAMKSFGTDPETTPGRLNIFEGEDYTVIVDHAHNADGFTKLSQFVGRLKVKGKKILVISGAGDRLDSEVKKNAAATAGYFDHYVCRNNSRPRGRKPHEMPALFKSGLMGAGVREDQITVVEDPTESFEYSLSLARPGDLVVMHHAPEEREAIWQMVTSRQKPRSGRD